MAGTSNSKLNSALNLCEESETEGFDFEAGQQWIYPSNYPEREYQFSIIQEALLKNTLVSLPTGLGKTFIAAVVMYNFYRWYPLGKIIFMAPTRPLVRQQVEACYDITAIPKETTAELTGTKIKTARNDVWNEKRVFFATPQVLQNDLNSVLELGSKIKCLVFDEAHKAKGNHAYCEVIRKLTVYSTNFRVLALSATPGSSLDDVADVIKNLLISHVEFRTDESVDVKPYTFERSLETVVIPLNGKLQQVRENYISILEKYTRTLIQYRVINGNCSTLSKGRFVMIMKEYQQKQGCDRDGNHGDIMRNLNICVTLYHAFELLTRNGLRSFLSFLEEHSGKPLIRNITELYGIMSDVQNYLGPAPLVEPLPDGTTTDVPKNTKFGHPKFYKLRDVLTAHFSTFTDSTRVIVFFEFKDSIREAFALLSQHRPEIRPMIFVGQGSITQRQQINVIKAFKEGSCNTLLSTCIGEEGLDVGEVDLIVCFDILNKSPVRMIQRMGRTGRKRKGRIVVLVTEGKEQQTLKECLVQKSYLSKNILTSKELDKVLYPLNPRMVPKHISPKCKKMHITVTKTVKTKTSSLKDLFNRISSRKSKISEDLDDVEIIETTDRLPQVHTYWNKDNPIEVAMEENKVNYARYLDKQRNVQAEGKILNSKTTGVLVSLLQFAESKLYNIPITQVPKMISQMTQVCQQKSKSSANSYKQSDIRSMFVKTQSSSETYDEVVVIDEVLSSCNSNLSNELELEIANYLSITASCATIDDEVFDYKNQQLIKNRQAIDLSNWVQPDIAILDNVKAENLSLFAESLSPTSCKLFKQLDTINVSNILSEDDSLFEQMSSSMAPEKVNVPKINYSPKDLKMYIPDNRSFQNEQCSNNFDEIKEEISYKCAKDVDDFVEDNGHDNLKETFSIFSFKTPDNLNNILKKLPNESVDGNNMTTSKHTLDNDPGCIKLLKKPDLKIVLDFFKLQSLNDIFVPSVEMLIKVFETTDTSITYSPILYQDKSPDLFSETSQILFQNKSPVLTYSQYIVTEGNQNSFSTNENTVKADDSGSPVLSSFERVSHLKNKVQKNLFSSTLKSTNKTPVKKLSNQPTLSNLSKSSKSSFYICKKSPVNINNFSGTVTFNEIICDDKSNETNLLKNDGIFNESLDIIDVSQENIFQMYYKETNVEHNAEQLDDFCDLSVFGINSNKSESIDKNLNIRKCNERDLQTEVDDKISKDKAIKSCENETKYCKKYATSETDISDLDDICDFSTFGIHVNTTKSASNKETENNVTTVENNVEKSLAISKSVMDLDLDDFCDLSVLGIVSNQTKENGNIENTVATKGKCDMKTSEFDGSNEKILRDVSISGSPVLNLNKRLSQNSKRKLSDSDDTMCSIISSIKKHKCNKIAPKSGEITQQKYPNNTTDTVIDLTGNGDSQSTNNSNESTQLTVTQMLDFLDDCKVDKTPKKLQLLKLKKPSFPLNATSSCISPINQSCSILDDLNNYAEFNNDEEILSSLKHTKTKNKLSLSKSSVDSDSDEEFESIPTKKWINKKPSTLQRFKKPTVRQNPPKRNLKKEKPVCKFINYEAEVDDSIVVSDDEIVEDSILESSFVTDEPSDANCTEMHVEYLKSTRDTHLNRGKFKIPAQPKENIENVYSQVVKYSQETYLEDSFCVHEDEEEEYKSNDMSELEIAELILSEKRKQRKLEKIEKECTTKKRRRIIVLSDSD